jgi:uncharacterized membrane protein (UPF0127 family)
MRAMVRFALLLAAVSMLAVATSACAHDPRVAIVAPGGDTLATVHVEIAATPPARETGLMYRSHLDEDAGMLFVFAAPAQLEFWMENTEIPLDMIFADANRRVIGVVANAQPYSEQHLGVDGQSLYVLEVNGGFAAHHHVEAGARLEFEGFTPRAAE